ncbi:hypothetical protein Fcan01_09074 [Folsomia candida]|uniref:DUF4780 domain-containing protein n=1 Tax=Folsomia candida TaxID=158441 RepID=A0A226EE79_FOLCA|nr:hypothetical protein Fcan01_09074 [Folsomia candida]
MAPQLGTLWLVRLVGLVKGHRSLLMSLKDFENSFRREKVSQPSGSSSEGSRKRAKDSPLDEASRAPPKRPTRREYEDEDSCSLLAVRFSDGRGELGANGMVSLQQGLWALIDEIGGPSALKMGGVRNRGGTVVVQCQDAFTKIWLEDKIPKLGGGVYSVSGWAPTWVKGSVWIPGQDLPDSKDIFQKISLHNNGLDTATWFTVTKPIRAGRGHLLVLRMDETSARFCSSNKIYYYTERLDFRFVRPITAEVKSSSSSSHNVDATATNVTIFEEALSKNLQGVSICNQTVDALDKSVNSLTDAILGAHEIACPLRLVKTHRKAVPWWTKELTGLRKMARKLRSHEVPPPPRSTSATKHPGLPPGSATSTPLIILTPISAPISTMPSST